MSTEHFRVDLQTGKILDRAPEYAERWAEEVRSKLNPEQSNMRELMEEFITLHDCNNAMIAEAVAEQLNQEAGKERYMAINRPNVFPQHSVIQIPQVGDDVSYGFNGDYYPCGKVAKISATKKKITTTDGSTFWRRGNTGSWLKNGTWSLVQGTINERNPHL